MLSMVLFLTTIELLRRNLMRRAVKVAAASAVVRLRQTDVVKCNRW